MCLCIWIQQVHKIQISLTTSINGHILITVHLKFRYKPTIKTTIKSIKSICKSLEEYLFANFFCNLLWKLLWWSSFLIQFHGFSIFFWIPPGGCNQKSSYLVNRKLLVIIIIIFIQVINSCFFWFDKTKTFNGNTLKMETANS